MLNKSFAFGLLAAGLMIAPGAALAQNQTNDQFIEQNGVAENGSAVFQDARLRNTQVNVNKNDRCYGRSNGADQDSRQTAVQNAAAFDDSVVDQRAEARNVQVNASERGRNRGYYRGC